MYIYVVICIINILIKYGAGELILFLYMLPVPHNINTRKAYLFLPVKCKLTGKSMGELVEKPVEKAMGISIGKSVEKSVGKSNGDIDWEIG